MMPRIFHFFTALLAIIASCASVPARADFAFTLGSGATAFSFTSTTGGTALCAASVTHCFASVPIDTAGAQLFASGNAGFARVASGGIASGAIASGAYASGAFASGSIASGAVASGAYASGSIASGAIVDLGVQGDTACATDNGTCTEIALIKRTNQRLTTVIAGIPVTNAGTFATQSAITAASGSIASGAMAAGSMVDLLTMRGTKAPGTAAANSILGGGVYTSSGVTLTDGQQAALQFSSTGNLLVQGVGVAQGSTTSGQTISPIGCRTLTAAPTDTTAQTNIPSCTTLGGQRMDLASVAGTAAVNGGTAGIIGIGGSTATNVALTDNPVNTGFQAISSQNAAVTTARKVQGVADLSGRQIITPYANPENWVQGTTSAMTGTTSTSLLAAPASGLRNYAWVSCVNSHATVGTFVTIQDGSGGTALATVAVAAVFGGQISAAPIPIRQPTTATALFVANVTTGANVICSATGYTSTL